jgi:hypothetical protein
MNFTPKNEQEIAAEGLLPAGLYDFEVITAEEKVSKSGNDMIALELKVYDAEGRTRFVRDWLLEAFLRKLMAFCKETNLRGAYEAGTLKAGDLVGKSGKVELAIEEKGDFPAKNTVKTYGSKASGTKSSDPLPAKFKPSAPQAEVMEDDIPF